MHCKIMQHLQQLDKSYLLYMWDKLTPSISLEISFKIPYVWSNKTFCSNCITCYGAVLPRRRPHYVSMLSVCLSVRPSVCPVPPPRGKTKRPTNTKLGRKGPRDTSTLWTNFKVNGSEVKVTAANCVVSFSISMFIVYCSHRVIDKTIDYFVLLRY